MPDPDPDRLCDSWKTMRMLPMRWGGALQWRGVDCSQTARFIHHTYRQPVDPGEKQLRTVGGASLPATGKARGKLYREGHELKARVAQWCPPCTPACIQSCDGLDNPIGAREDITVQPVLVLYWDGGGACCTPSGGGLWAVPLHLCGDAGNCNPTNLEPGFQWPDEGCVSLPCCTAEDGWNCTLMATWSATCTQDDIDNFQCCTRGDTECYINESFPTAVPMRIFAEVAAYCCWRLNDETGEIECCQHLRVRLIGFAEPQNDSTITSETTPGCCLTAGAVDPLEMWDTGILYEGCTELSSVSPPASETVCGAFSEEVGLTNAACTGMCEGTTVTIEGAEE